MPDAIAVIVDSQSASYVGNVEASMALPAETKQQDLDGDPVRAQSEGEVVSGLLPETATHCTSRFRWLT
jgi:hypothetical protein